MIPLDQFLKKYPVPSGMSSSEWGELAQGMDNSAFFSAKVEDARLLSRLQELIKDYLASTKVHVGDKSKNKVSDQSDFVDQARQFMLMEGLAEIKPGDKFNNNLRNIGGYERLKLIFRVQTDSAIGYAKWYTEMHPTAMRLAPAWRFRRLPGAKIKRFVHMINENTVRLKTDFDFWADEMNSRRIGGFEVPWAPFGFNSYMTLEPVSLKECKRLGLVKPGDRLKKPDTSRFGFNIEEQYNYGKKASTRGLSPEAAQKLKKELSERFVVSQQQDFIKIQSVNRSANIHQSGDDTENKSLIGKIGDWVKGLFD